MVIYSTGPNDKTRWSTGTVGDLEKELDTSFLKLGTCSLHPVHTAFRKGIKELCA